MREKNYVVTSGGDVEQAMVVTEKERKSKRWDVNKSIRWVVNIQSGWNVDDEGQFEKLRRLKELKNYEDEKIMIVWRDF